MFGAVSTFGAATPFGVGSTFDVESTFGLAPAFTCDPPFGWTRTQAGWPTHRGESGPGATPSHPPGNVSEACGKRPLPQLRASLDFAGGSLSELEYWFILGRDLDCMSAEQHATLGHELDEVRRLLLGFGEWAAAEIAAGETPAGDRMKP